MPVSTLFFIVTNMLFSFVFFFLFLYKYIADKCRPMLIWSIASLFTGGQFVSQMLYAKGLIGVDLLVFVGIILVCYMAFLIYYAVLVMTNSEIPRGLVFVFAGSIILMSFYAYFVADAPGGVERTIPCRVFLGLALIAAAILAARKISTKDKSQKVVAAKRLLIAGLVLHALIMVPVVMAELGAVISGLLLVAAQLSKFLLAGSLLLFYFNEENCSTL